ncbi:MAG: type I 3-dehydroquinate dehydratase [Vicinamibacterales bacterium]
MAPVTLCATVSGATTAELVAARDRVADADMVELRLDGLEDLSVETPAAVLAGRRLPAIVTCRAGWEGGRFTGPEAAREAILRQALAEGAEWVDVEWRAGFAGLVREHAERIVLSYHDFAGVPGDLPAVAAAMRATGAAVVKVAVTPARLSEVLALRHLVSGPAVLIAMGDRGLFSRLLPSRMGSRWTYAGAAAPGQLSVERMRTEFRVETVTETTRVYGVVGNNVLHSLSPAMHNAAFAAAGVDAVYVPLLPVDFDDFLLFAEGVGLAGASVTVPFKVEALRAAGSADAVAARVGAANTLARTGSQWTATNTDVDGFLSPLAGAGVAVLPGVRCAVLGAGGAARAVVAGLVARGAIVTVHARREAQARDVAAAFGALVGAWPVPDGSWDVLVNTTPAGGATARDESPLPGGPFGGQLVYDLTYGPEEPRLLREARAAGCRTLDGLPMLVAQAEQQFAWWTGRPAPPGIMAAAARARLDAARTVSPVRPS